MGKMRKQYDRTGKSNRNPLKMLKKIALGGVGVGGGAKIKAQMGNLKPTF